MIDQRVFLEEIGILMDWYNRDFEEATLKRLHQRLSAYLTTEQFVIAALTVFDKSRFFPTVEEFVSAVIGDAETKTLHEWDLCVKAAARGDRTLLAELSQKGQSALHLVGGLSKLGMATEEQLTWIKKEFVSVWKSTPCDIKTLPSSRTEDLEQMHAVKSLSQKMGMSGNGR